MIQKALQITKGNKFIEMIEMVKKVSESLKCTNFGKKIYENLMNNYAEYLTINATKQPKNTLGNSKKKHNGKIHQVNLNILSDKNKINYNKRQCEACRNHIERGILQNGVFLSSNSNVKKNSRGRHINTNNKFPNISNNPIENKEDIILADGKINISHNQSIYKNVEKYDENLYTLQNTKEQYPIIINKEEMLNIINQQGLKANYNWNYNLNLEFEKSFSYSRPSNSSLI